MEKELLSSLGIAAKSTAVGNFSKTRGRCLTPKTFKINVLSFLNFLDDSVEILLCVSSAPAASSQQRGLEACLWRTFDY